jgi:hypothetical protein
VGLPYLFNDQTLEFYKYYISEVLPAIEAKGRDGSFRSFSLLPSLSQLAGLTLPALWNLLAVGVLSIGLAIPIFRYSRREFNIQNNKFRFTAFGALVATIPLTFPISEAHHLLLQIIPFIAVLAYWRSVIESGGSIFRDRISLVFVLSVLLLQFGHIYKATPLRLFGVLAVYIGLIALLRQWSGRTARPLTRP